MHMKSKLTLAQCYEILELRPGAKLEQIKSAWRTLSKRWHPDQCMSGSEDHSNSLEKQIALNHAYEQLIEKVSRNGPAPAEDVPPKSGKRKNAEPFGWTIEEESCDPPTPSRSEFPNILNRAKSGDAQSHNYWSGCV